MSHNNLDERGLLGPYPENCIVFTAEYWYLKKRKYGFIDLLLLRNSHSSLMVDALYSQIKSIDPLELVSLDRNEKWSHDNHTAWLCLAKILNWDINKYTFPIDWLHRCHPRDLMFYGYIKWGRKFTYLVQALLFILTYFLPYIGLPLVLLSSVSFNMILSCLDTRKANNGILRTSGKLLAWLRMEAFPNEFRLTKRICDAIIKKKFGNWANIFKVYFGSDHINTKLAREIYEKERRITKED